MPIKSGKTKTKKQDWQTLLHSALIFFITVAFIASFFDIVCANNLYRLLSNQ